MKELSSVTNQRQFGINDRLNVDIQLRRGNDLKKFLSWVGGAERPFTGLISKICSESNSLKSTRMSNAIYFFLSLK